MEAFKAGELQSIMAPDKKRFIEAAAK